MFHLVSHIVRLESKELTMREKLIVQCFELYTI